MTFITLSICYFQLFLQQEKIQKVHFASITALNETQQNALNEPRPLLHLTIKSRIMLKYKRYPALSLCVGHDECAAYLTSRPRCILYVEHMHVVQIIHLNARSGRTSFIYDFITSAFPSSACH